MRSLYKFAGWTWCNPRHPNMLTHVLSCEICTCSSIFKDQPHVGCFLMPCRFWHRKLWPYCDSNSRLVNFLVSFYLFFIYLLFMVDVDTTLPKQVYVGIRHYLAIIMPTEPSCTFLVRRHNRNCQKVSLKMAETFDKLLRTLVFQKHFHCMCFNMLC